MENKQNDRRSFIRNLGMGAAATLGAPMLKAEKGERPDSTDARGRLPDTELIVLANGIQLELRNIGNEFLGIGKVLAPDHTLLREGSLPLFCDIRSPDGIAITRYFILEKRITPEKIFLKMNVERHASGVMEYMLHTVRNRESLYGWVDGPVKDEHTIVSLEILPVTRQIGQAQWQGFSYQYAFYSPDFSIYKILDRSTWEINGRIAGNECWMRIGHIPSIVRLEKIEDRYSTENYYKGIANPNVFQFLPLQTELQGFTFAAHEEGVLITYASQVSHVRTLIEKPHDKDQLFHYHQHCNDLSHDFRPGPMEVLWLSKKKTNTVNRYNIYESVRSFVHKSLHQQVGIKEEYISTYGQIEEWTEPDFDRYTNDILPQLVARGVKRIFLPNEFQNAMNTWGLSNMCCNVDFKFSETAGIEKIKRFCVAAKAAGIIVEMWGNTAISTLVELFRYKDGKKKGIDFLPEKNSVVEVLERATEPYVRNPSNAIEADHYTPRFAALNLRDPAIMQYWMDCWKAAYKTGIGAIFLDSSFNMSSDKFHFIQNTDKDHPVKENVQDEQRYYRPKLQPESAILTQYPAHLQLIREMQHAGYSYCGEDLGVFGIHRHGPDMDRIISCMPLWRECVINFESAKLPQGANALAVFFKGLAYRIGWSVRWDFNTNKADAGIEDPRALQMVKAFNAVNEWMKEREIQEEEKAVQYTATDGKTMVLWTLDAHKRSFSEKKTIWDVINNKKHRASFLEASAMGVYVIT